MKRRSVRWLVRLGLLILAVTIVLGLVAVTLRGRDPEGFAGQWQRTGVPDTILTVERDGGDYRVRFEDRGSDVSQTVPATLSGHSLVTSTPLDTAVASALEIPSGVLVSLAKADGGLYVGADSGRGSPIDPWKCDRYISYRPSSLLGWTMAIATVCAFGVLVAALIMGRPAQSDRPHKAMWGLAAASAAMLVVALATGLPYLVVLGWLLLGACYLLFVLRGAPQVPEVANGVARLVSEKKWQEHEADEEPQEVQRERGEALKQALDKEAERRGVTPVDDASADRDE